MTVKHNTEYTCDGCGKYAVEKKDSSTPPGWTIIIFIGGDLGHRDKAHVCSRACGVVWAHKLADEIDLKSLRPFSQGGPYR